MRQPQLIEITAVSTGYSSGQRLVSAVIEYSDAVIGSLLTKEAYRVEGFDIVDVCASDSLRGGAVRTGRFVQLVLDSSGENAQLCHHVGAGPHGHMEIIQPALLVSQLLPVLTAGGMEVPPFEGVLSSKQDRGMTERFLTASFATSDGKRLAYDFYAPERIVRGQKYPVVLFLHDAGSCSPDVEAPLMQGTGATVWALESDYGRRPCYVVAPHYPTVCANDDFAVTWEADATVELVEALCDQYAIDRTRIYATGQSMGCMMICELLLRNPHFFAGCLLVAGQWDPARMAAARDENLWAVVSGGDVKAFPIMSACFHAMRDAGGLLSVGHVDAKADAAWLDAAIRTQKSANCNLNFTWFEGRSVIPDGLPDNPGLHHVCTWRKAYDIKALREWLFEQRLYEGKYAYD